MHAGLGAVAHGVHEDGGQKLVEDDAHLGPDQLVGEDLGEQLGCLRADVGVRVAAVHVQQVDESTCKTAIA